MMVFFTFINIIILNFTLPKQHIINIMNYNKTETESVQDCIHEQEANAILEEEFYKTKEEKKKILQKIDDLLIKKKKFMQFNRKLEFSYNFIRSLYDDEDKCEEDWKEEEEEEENKNFEINKVYSYNAYIIGKVDFEMKVSIHSESRYLPYKKIIANKPQSFFDKDVKSFITLEIMFCGNKYEDVEYDFYYQCDLTGKVSLSSASRS